MSIQRYTSGFAPNMFPALLKCAEGDAVLYTEHLADKEQTLAQVTRERDEAVEALRFYANADNYTMGPMRDGYFDVCTSIEDDKGEISRAVLAKIGKVKS